MLNLPSYIYSQLFSPRGNSQKKAPRWQPPIVYYNSGYIRDSENWQSRVYGSHRGQGYRDYTKSEDSKTKQSDFRYYWMSEFPSSTWAKCRACKAVFWNATLERRREHLIHSEFKCGKYLVKAYQRLLKDKLCVVCDKITSNTKWGVPVCEGNCETVWKHQDVREWGTLNEALRLVGFVESVLDHA